MATGFTDFSGYTADALPSDWTIRFNTSSGDVLTKADAGATGGKVLRILTSGGTTGYFGASWDAIDAHSDRDDIEVYCKYRFNQTGSNQECLVFGRGSGTALANSNLYAAGQARSGGGSRAITERNSGSRSTKASSSYLPDDNVWQHAVIRINATSISAKFWAGVETEPETWTLTATDSSTSAAGFAGIVSGAYVSGQIDNVDVDVIGYGTGGDSAPRTAASSTPVSFSGTVPTQNLTEDSAMSALDLSSYFSGTETPFSYAVQTGTLPAGLSLNSSTGVISGTPTATGTASIVVRATDDGSDTADTNSFDIVVAAADVTAPTLSSPSGTQTGSTTAELSVSTNEGNGALYWVVTTSATSPSVAQVQAGQDHTGAAAADDGSQAVSGTGAQSANATGLTADTAYYVHFQQEDAATNDSTVSTSSSFTTAAVAVKGIQLSLKQADGTTAAASLTGLYYHAWDALNPGGASDANGSTETTDGSGVLEININSFSAAIDGEVFLFVYDLDGTEDKDSVCFAGRVPVVDIS
ncbi:Ig domain-containing protein [Haliea salexigens]|uniref:Ig domain-containing protein n=1 Tax=Haliea salexigens TaxID=287487 RepID=UPI00041F879D|nr:Ig domain-containing protein [Haliea salexigens]